MKNTPLRPIYLDFSSTTPIHPDLGPKILEWVSSWGNPSSIHWAGRAPKAAIRDSRLALSQMLRVSPLELIFTSGGSEANNTVILGCFDSFLESQNSRSHFMCSQVEHPSVLKSFEYLASKGAKVDYIPVNRDGAIDLDFYEKHLTERTALVSVMYANNETGVLFPIQKMAEMARQKGALFHTDAVQALGKLNLDLSSNGLGVDYATFSGHKYYALKGVGLIFARKGANYSPLIHGGRQERQRRAGTENVLAISSLGYMAEAFSEKISIESMRLQLLRKYFEERILSEIPNVHVTGERALRLPNISSLIIDGVDGETLLMSLDLKGIAVSTGAACSSGSPEPSHTLLAMGLSRREAQNSLRVSMGWQTTQDEIGFFIETLKETVGRLRAIDGESSLGMMRLI